jgi:maltooligosyltrehalose trehalohydrolase
MGRDAEGWFELLAEGVAPGTAYHFRLGNGLAVPDPASRLQLGDVHGPSVVVDPTAYRWRNTGWTGRPWEEAVIYELHLGTFTEDGTFRRRPRTPARARRSRHHGDRADAGGAVLGQSRLGL